MLRSAVTKIFELCNAMTKIYNVWGHFFLPETAFGLHKKKFLYEWDPLKTILGSVILKEVSCGLSRKKIDYFRN